MNSTYRHFDHHNHPTDPVWITTWVGDQAETYAQTDRVVVTCEPRPMGKTRRGSMARYTYHRAGRDQGRRYVKSCSDVVV